MPFIPVPDWNAYTTYQSLETVDYSYAVGVPTSIYNVITGQTSIVGTPPTNGSGVLNTHWAATTTSSSSAGVITAGTDIILAPTAGTGTVTISQKIVKTIPVTTYNPSSLLLTANAVVGLMATIIPCGTVPTSYQTFVTIVYGNNYPTTRTVNSSTSSTIGFCSPVWLSTVAYTGTSTNNVCVYYLTAGVPSIYSTAISPPVGTLPTNAACWTVLQPFVSLPNTPTLKPSVTSVVSSRFGINSIFRLSTLNSNTFSGVSLTIPASTASATSWGNVIYAYGGNIGATSGIIPIKCNMTTIALN